MCPRLVLRPYLALWPIWALLMSGASPAVMAQPSAAPAPAASSGPARTPARPEPTDARATVPPLRHVSALPAHTRSAPVAVGDWAALNQQAARIGGWRAYAREAAAPEPAALPASASASAAAGKVPR